MVEKKKSPKGKSVRVTFELPAEAANTSVAIVGDFNDWSEDEHMMKLDEKKGVWTTGVSFKPGTTVQFRYLVDGKEWKNEEEADGYVETPFFSQNSLLEL